MVPLREKKKNLLTSWGYVPRITTICFFFLFSPQSKFSDLTNLQKISINWLSKKLHGLDWNSENYLYTYLTQFVQGLRLRNPRSLATYYAKGLKELLSELIDCPIIDLSTLDCPKISVFYSKLLEYSSTQHGGLNKLFVRENACFYFDWLTNER